MHIILTKGEKRNKKEKRKKKTKETKQSKTKTHKKGGGAEEQSQRMPSTEGEKKGSLEAQRLAFPRQRDTERRWKR